MTQCLIHEADKKKLSTLILPVEYSTRISQEIDSISTYNIHNTESLLEWHNYLDRATDYLSNSLIAFDYAGMYPQLENDVIVVNDWNYNLKFIIQTDEFRSIVCILEMDLKAEEYGLDVPPMFEDAIIEPRYYIPMNITGDKVATDTTSDDYGADYVSESKMRKIRISEARLQNIISESIRKVLYN